MNLTYRGIQYNYNPSSVDLLNDNAGETIAIGTYRGASMRVRKAQGALSQQPGLDLKYRGVNYSTSPAMQKKVAAPVVAATPVAVAEDRARTLVLNHHRAIRQRHQATLSRFATQIGLKGTAAFQHLTEANVEPIDWTASDRNYDRSHVAFS